MMKMCHVQILCKAELDTYDYYIAGMGWMTTTDDREVWRKLGEAYA